MLTKRFIYIFALVLLFWGLGASAAETITLPNPLACDDGGGSQLQCVVERIVRGLFVIIIPICSIMILYGGFQIMSSGGDPEKAKKGRQTITYAIVGLVVVLVAEGLVALIRVILSGTPPPAGSPPPPSGP